jgi:hypothetical protein
MVKVDETNSREKMSQIVSKVNNTQGTIPKLGNSIQAQVKLGSN